MSRETGQYTPPEKAERKKWMKRGGLAAGVLGAFVAGKAALDAGLEAVSPLVDEKPIDAGTKPEEAEPVFHDEEGKEVRVTVSRDAEDEDVKEASAVDKKEKEVSEEDTSKLDPVVRDLLPIPGLTSEQFEYNDNGGKWRITEKVSGYAKKYLFFFRLTRDEEKVTFFGVDYQEIRPGLDMPALYINYITKDFEDAPADILTVKHLLTELMALRERYSERWAEEVQRIKTDMDRRGYSPEEIHTVLFNELGGQDENLKKIVRKLNEEVKWAVDGI